MTEKQFYSAYKLDTNYENQIIKYFNLIINI